MAPEVKEEKEQTNMICEQGSLGLWATPLSDEDQELYDKSQENSKED